MFLPQKGFNTLTGETGAGKSILLGALGLVTGKRADTQVLYDKNTKCVVEANFDLKNHKLEIFFEELDLDYDTDCIIRREISPKGKSRAFINDTPVTLDTLKKLGAHLVDIHSQHETLELNKETFQTTILDLLAESTDLKEKYSTQFRKTARLKKEIEQTIISAEQDKKELDYQLFLLKELEDLPLEELNQQELEEDVKRIENFTEIKSLISNTYGILEENELSSANTVGEAVKLANDLSGISSEYTPISERLNAIFYELQDISKELANLNDQLDFDDEGAVQKIEQYNKLQALLKKHTLNNTQELLELRDSLKSQTSKTQNLDEHIEELNIQLRREHEALITLGGNLHKKRQTASSKIAKQIIKICQTLGMPEIDFLIDFSALETPQKHGLYQIKFLFSANKGIVPEEISKVASGGEFGRLMFAIKSLLASKTALPTIVFDEIDTGISGEIALKMGQLMKSMGTNHQLICITHLPQVASKGDQQFYIYKENEDNKTVSKIKALSTEERQAHIATMIAGENPGETALLSAKELLEN